MKPIEMLKAYRLLVSFYKIDINKAKTWGASPTHIDELQLQLDKFVALARFYESLI